MGSSRLLCSRLCFELVQDVRHQQISVSGYSRAVQKSCIPNLTSLPEVEHDELRRGRECVARALPRARCPKSVLPRSPPPSPSTTPATVGCAGGRGRTGICRGQVGGAGLQHIVIRCQQRLCDRHHLKVREGFGDCASRSLASVKAGRYDTQSVEDVSQCSHVKKSGPSVFNERACRHPAVIPWSVSSIDASNA